MVQWDCLLSMSFFAPHTLFVLNSVLLAFVYTGQLVFHARLSNIMCKLGVADDAKMSTKSC